MSILAPDFSMPWVQIASPPLQSTNAALTAPWSVPLELTWFLLSVRREETDPLVADIISASESRKSVWLRRQQWLEEGCRSGRFAVDWTVPLHTLPYTLYMVQFWRGHFGPKVVPDQIDVEAMDCRQQRGRGSKMSVGT
jgi:hypothetical protein